MKIKYLIKCIKKAVKIEDRFFDANEAYQVTRYKEILSKEQLKEDIIEDLKRSIIFNSKISRQFMTITTYDGHREKTILPEVAEFFRALNYHVDLLNDEEYKEVNVLIINWQNSETFE